MDKGKIGLIGAGSGCFSLSLIKDLCHSEVLDGFEISLMDIDKERLDAVHAIAKRLVEELGASIRVEKTMDRIRCISGADYIINTALAAPHYRLREGWKIAQKYGFKFGGSYHVMYDEAFWVNFYQLKLFESITEDILKYAPEAWHLLVANPVVAGITHIKRKYREAKIVGLCHGYGMVKGIASMLGLSVESLVYEIPGVNHFVWLNSAYAGTDDLFVYLNKWIEEKSGEHWKNCGISDKMGRKRMDFYKKHRVVGIGDTLGWTGACWPWWYHSDDETEKFYGEYQPMDGWNSYFTMVEENAAWMKELKVIADNNESMQDKLGKLWTDDLMVPLIESLHGGAPQVYVVNITNEGALVPGLPEDFEVEVPAYCSKRGIDGIKTSPLPRSIIAHTLRDRVAPVEMELCALNERNLDFLHELVLMDKWATSSNQVEAFVDEILNLPYHEEMREYYCLY